MAFLSDIFKFIIRYRIHMAVLAGLTTIMPFRASMDGVTTQALLAGLAMAMLTMSIHLSNKLADAPHDAADPRTLPLYPNSTSFILKLSQALFILPIAWLFFNPPVLVSYIIFGGVLGYMVNYGFSWGGKRHRLKNVFLVKNLVPALSYALCVSLPYAMTAHDGVPAVFIVHLVSAFVFILLNEILNDIRDVDADRAAGVKTIPNTIGLMGTRIFGLALMAAFVAWIFMTVRPSIALPPVYAIMALIFLCASERRSWWYYHLMIGLWVVILGAQFLI